MRQGCRCRLEQPRSESRMRQKLLRRSCARGTGPAGASTPAPDGAGSSSAPCPAGASAQIHAQAAPQTTPTIGLGGHQLFRVLAHTSRWRASGRLCRPYCCQPGFLASSREGRGFSPFAPVPKAREIQASVASRLILYNTTYPSLPGRGVTRAIPLFSEEGPGVVAADRL